MRIGPAEIILEPGHAQWRVSTQIRGLSYYTHWYHSERYTRLEALREYAERLKGFHQSLIQTRQSELEEVVQQLRNALIFLEAEEE